MAQEWRELADQPDRHVREPGLFDHPQLHRSQ